MPSLPSPRSTSLVLSMLLLAGCQAMPRLGAPAPVSGMALAEAATLDRAGLLQLSAETLAAADRDGQAEVVAAFVAHADGPDADPAASREIARQAVGSRTKASPELARIAAGGAKRRLAKAQTAIRFPEDEGTHATAITEWWYLNGHLKAADGATFGYELTLFQIGPVLHWAHVALTDEKGQHFSYSRDWTPPSQARSAAGKLDVRYGAQAIARNSDGTIALAGVADGHKFSLALTSNKRALLIGGDGKIDMPEGKDSWYYSLTRLTATGTVDGKPVTGLSWMDHQWGPFWVTGFRDRWDWFALQFDDDTEYNLFGFRDAAGHAGARHVNASMPSGESRQGSRFEMDRLKWWQSPVTQKYFTTQWRVNLPDTHETVELEAANVDQELSRRVNFFHDPLPNYWEGSMRATKIAADGRRIPGVAYCEHFGLKTPEGPRVGL